ncbi:hypothetical protein BHE74_00014920 [Ensete ventricosum]|nr:hypothetical protein BHE74_00014920 [Ensete ventricosum]
MALLSASILPLSLPHRSRFFPSRPSLSSRVSFDGIIENKPVADSAIAVSLHSTTEVETVNIAEDVTQVTFSFILIGIMRQVSGGATDEHGQEVRQQHGPQRQVVVKFMVWTIRIRTNQPKTRDHQMPMKITQNP